MTTTLATPAPMDQFSAQYTTTPICAVTAEDKYGPSYFADEYSLNIFISECGGAVAVFDVDRATGEWVQRTDPRTLALLIPEGEDEWTDPRYGTRGKISVQAEFMSEPIIGQPAMVVSVITNTKNGARRVVRSEGIYQGVDRGYHSFRDGHIGGTPQGHHGMPVTHVTTH